MFYREIKHSLNPYFTTSGTRVAYFPYVTLASGISINSRLFYCCCFQNGRQFKVCRVEQKTKQVDVSKHFKLLMYLLVFLTCCEVCCVLYLVLASAVLVRKLFFTIKMLIFIVIVYYIVTVKVHIINRTLHRCEKIWILCSRVKNNTTRT